MASYEDTLPVSNQIAPKSTRSTYPTHSDEFGLGGYRSVLTIAERDDIKVQRRKNGMLVYVIENDTTYMLKSEMWEEVTVSLSIQSKDDTLIFDNLSKILIDTNKGLSLSTNGEGHPVLAGTESFETITVGNEEIKADANNANTNLEIEKTATVTPVINNNKLSFNTKSYIYKSDTASIFHVIEHNLGLTSVIINIFSVNTDGTMEYIMTPHTILDENNIEINLTIARKIIVNIIPLSPIL